MSTGKPTKRFCTDKDPGKGNCKDEFHRNGGAFGPLKIKLEKLVAKMAREKFKELSAQIEALEKRVGELEEPTTSIHMND